MSEFIKAPPIAENFIKTLRKFGYTMQSAIADIIDNSISASAKNINILYLPNSSWLSIIDDGNGINVEKIKEKAIEKELYTKEEIENMSKGRVLQILFEAGLSTAEKVTSVSGRGVGMDMVKSSIEEFGGKIVINSDFGKGSRFLLQIPIPRYTTTTGSRA